MKQPEDWRRLIIENADIIERLAKCNLRIVDGNTGQCFRIENGKLVATGKRVNPPTRKRPA